MDHGLDEGAASWGVLTPSTWRTASLHHKFIRGDDGRCSMHGAGPEFFFLNDTGLAPVPSDNGALGGGGGGRGGGWICPCNLSDGDGCVRVNVLLSYFILFFFLFCIAAVQPEHRHPQQEAYFCFLFYLFIFQWMRKKKTQKNKNQAGWPVRCDTVCVGGVGGDCCMNQSFILDWLLLFSM